MPNFLRRCSSITKYTLVEPLEEVAIIGVLVAVSIPIFTSQLRKAKVATDLANIRAAKAAAAAQYLTSDKTDTVIYNYDAGAGVVYVNTDTTHSAGNISAYGKTSDPAVADGFDATDNATHVGKIVEITITGDTATNNATTTYKWVAGKA